MIHIILYQPEKPSNTGNILRTAMASDAFVHIIGPLTFSLDEKSLKRAGMDYLKFAKYDYFDDYAGFLKEYPDEKIYYVTRYGLHNYAEMKYESADKDIFLMFGKESTGIPKEILKAHREYTIRIPMRIDARSLNLSNSVAIVTYEVLRQQKFIGLAEFETIKKDVI